MTTLNRMTTMRESHLLQAVPTALCLLWLLQMTTNVEGSCSPPSSMSCTVKVRTGTRWFGGTAQNIYINIFGTNGVQTGEQKLGGSFGMGDVATTTFTVRYASPVSNIVIRGDGSGSRSDWDMDWVELKCDDAGIDMHFGCGCWIDGGSKSLTTPNKISCSSHQTLSHGRVSCTGGTTGGSICTYSCEDNYKLHGPECVRCLSSQSWSESEGSSVCKELCHWRRSHCYPGSCGGPTGPLASSCTCQDGFKLTSTSGARCDLDTVPELSTCRVKVEDSQGTETMSMFTGTSTHCHNQRDEGINTVPTILRFAMKAGFNMTLTHNQPYVTDDAKVGVTGLHVAVVKRKLTGTEETLVPNKVLRHPPICQQSVDSLHPLIAGIEHDCEDNITLPSNLHLQDGDSVCADMKAEGGGFYHVTDNYNRPHSTETFTSTYSTKRVCFIYDMTKPLHCSDPASPNNACFSEPLTLSTRLTRHPEVEVTVNGWVDPRPLGGESNEKSASGVDWYLLEVHNMMAEHGQVTMEHGAITELSQRVNVASYSYPSGANVSTVTVQLPHIDDARLYGLILEVHDKAGNVRYARRLVLLDNSSFVDSNDHSPITVIHANHRSGNKWQTDVSTPLCVKWTDHFYNTKLRNNNFLLPVAPSSSSLDINDRYEQTVGTLSVNGTPNVMGVTKFEVAFIVDNSSKSAYSEIADVSAQTTCLQQPLKDGETYDVYVKASDIMNNTKEDSVRVSIDHTGPEVSVWGLRGRWDTDGLFVHNSTDLSTMKLVLTAADPHSGLHSIRWTLGTSPLASDVGERNLGVQRLSNVTSCSGQADSCYCPAVGPCENDRYFITFNNLVDNSTDKGDHHRQYFITIIVTNVASLTTTTPLDLLLDDTPPFVGVVWEGLSVDEQAEMDFTSSRMMHVRWHGFEDHESGVRLYRVVLAERCLNAEEVDSDVNATDVQYPQSMTSFVFSQEGHYYVSVVAYNGALRPSKAACSDGITYDTTPPALVNVSLSHARSGHMIGCTQHGAAWLVNSNLTRVALSNVSECNQLCSANSTARDVQHLPLSSSNTLDTQLSERHCRTLPSFTQNSYVLLPSDYVRVTWQGDDAESAMEEYYVGMGGDITSSQAPDLLAFTPTHCHPSYHARHAGLSHGDVVYIFLRAVNKAGLTANLTLGPVLIDVTPPDVIKNLTTVLEGKYMQVKWSDDVFIDAEQPQGVDFDFSFRIGYDGGFVTPFLELPESSLAQCRHGNVSGCARYPVSALQSHDPQQGRSFFFQLHVINSAGHVTSVNTSSVRLPAHFPPSHAVVLDVLKILVAAEVDSTVVASTTIFSAGDKYSSVTYPTTADAVNNNASSTNPNYVHDSMSSFFELPTYPTSNTLTPPASTSSAFAVQLSDDVDAVLEREEICTAWSGFYHQEDVTIEAGLGTTPDTDDFLNFQPVKSGDGYFCFNLTSAPVYIKLFSVVRATSSGGVAVFSSDGFVLVSRSDFDNAIRIFNGPGCHSNDLVGSCLVDASSRSFHLERSLKTPPHTGDVYFLQFSPFVPHVTFTDATLMRTTLKGYEIVAMTTNMLVDLPFSSPPNVSVRIMQCRKNSELLPLPSDHVTLAWEVEGLWERWVRNYRLEVVDDTCLQQSVKKTKYGHQVCQLAQTTTASSEREVTIHTTNLFHLHTYHASIQPCFDDGCLTPVTSDPVTFVHPSFLTLSLNDADVLRMSNTEIEVEATAGLDVAGLSPNQSCVYKWMVSRDSTASLPLTSWAVGHADHCSSIQIKNKVGYNGDGKSSLYLCLHLISPWTTLTPQCSTLRRTPGSISFQPFHLVELDHETFRFTDFQPFLHSQQLGPKLHQLFDLDLDFAKSEVMLSAVLTNSEGRHVTWFLMTSRHLPQRGNCAGDAECVTSMVTTTGRVTFPRDHAQLVVNRVYFICAVTSSLQIDVEVCGDGVVIDDTPPVAGVVAIGNADNGFLGSRGFVSAMWTGFSDIERVVTYIPDDVTMFYSVALGSYPGAEDVAGFVPVGQRTSWTFFHLPALSSTALYATVRAEDRVGHVTQVASDHVVVDGTPPSVGRVTVGTTTEERFIAGHELSVHWDDVEDRESGLQTIEVGVAQDGGGDNVIDFQKCEGTSITLTDTSVLVDGQAYVVLLKVTNKAGLTTLQSSESFVIDRTPPSPGRVWHSGRNTSTPSGYSTEVGVYSVEWAGFEDPHSGLQYYRIGLGSSPEQTDVVPFIYVGTQTSYTWRQDFEQGRKLYAIVQACNRAGLCRMTSSNSLTFDNSPPTFGHVTVGLYGRHDKFLGHNTSVPVQWTGFSDPQTGVQHFTWCVGTSPYTCDITGPIQTLLSSAAHGAGLTLPVDMPLYVTVRARNPAGLETVSVSESFKVDLTPPDLLIRPHFLSPRDGQPPVGQWDRSQLHVTWKFRDPESSVVSHTVYIRSKLTGRLVVNPVLLGADDELTITLDGTSLLCDGDLHWTSVTACNAAHLCVTSTSDVIIVDSTPPVSGTFLSPLRWTATSSYVTSDPVIVTTDTPYVTTIIDVIWRDFSDAESGVLTYRLLAGREYNSEELSEGRVLIVHDNSSVIQRYSLQLREELQSGEIIHLALLAENALGLTSPLLRATFRCHRANATSGTLVLVRHSCRAAYCDKDCACTADGKCQDDLTVSACRELNATLSDAAPFTVVPYMGKPVDSSQHGNTQLAKMSQKFSTSAKCLEGHWSLLQPESLSNVSRFQFSFGLAGRPAGEDVFDGQAVWYDVGRHMTAVHCLPGTRTLRSGENYVIFVRVWPSIDSFVTFTSSNMMVDHTPPKVRRGNSVIESDVTCSKDLDYVSKKDFYVTACWAGVFQDTDSGVVKYEVWMGTTPVASEHVSFREVGLNTSWTIPTMPLEHGTRYYVTVRAWNEAGLQTTAVSDGFLVDVTSPVPGVVFNTDRHRSAHAQSSATEISASWHGFEDRHSGVRSYQVAVYDVSNNTYPVMPFRDVGSKNRLSLHSLTLEHKHSYKVSVTAKDAANHQSPNVESDAILVDVTPPEGVTCSSFRLEHESSLLLLKPSPSHLHDRYEEEISLNVAQNAELLRLELRATGLHRSAAAFIQLAQLKMPLNFQFSPLEGARAQHDFISPETGHLALKVVVVAPRGATINAKLYRCTNTVVSPRDAVTIRQVSPGAVSVCARIRDAESGVKTMMVGVGTTEGGLQVAPWMTLGHSGHVTLPVNVQHASPLFATAVTQNHAGQWSRHVSQPIIFDATPPRVSDVTLTLKYEGEGQDNTTVWAEGRWTVEDEQSGVEVCTCTVEGVATLQPPDTEQRLYGIKEGHCRWMLRHFHHMSEVKVAVTCVNSVQLQSSVTSRPVYVLLRPPDVSQVLVESLSNNALVSPYHSVPQVRSGNSSLQFFWHGVQDPTLTSVYYRFLQGTQHLSEWSPLPLFKTAAILERERERSGTVTLELKVANERKLASQTSASVILDDATPILTGEKATLSVTGDKQVTLDWGHVFRVNGDFTFSVFVGTQPGFGDIINHVTTTGTRYEGKSAVLVTSVVYVSIQAVYDNGKSTFYQDLLMTR